MILKILLIVAVLAIMAVFLRSYSSRTRALTKILALAFVAIAVLAILFPDWTTHLANLIGIGRGADLVLYCLVVVVIFMAVNNSLRRRIDDQRFAKLVRQISLMEAPDVPPAPPVDGGTGDPDRARMTTEAGRMTDT